MAAFTWTAPDGATITIPAIDDIPAGTFRRYRKETPIDFLFSVLEDIADPDELAKVDALTVSTVNDLFQAWQDDKAVSVPQS